MTEIFHQRLLSEMDEMFSELSAHIDSQRYVISSLSEKCRELLKPRKYVHEIEAPRSSPLKNNEKIVSDVNSEEKQQLEMIEKLLQKAAKIRSGYEQKEQKQKTISDTHAKNLQQEHSKPLKKQLAKENQNPARPHSSDAWSTISLSQLQTIHAPSATKPSSSSQQSLKKKPTFLPAHLSAPYKTFAQFKFPARTKRKAATARTLLSSRRSTALPSTEKNPAKHEPTAGPLETAQATNFDGCGKAMVSEEDVVGKMEEPHDPKDEDRINPVQESPKDLKEMGKYLKMPPEYSTLLAQNNKLRRKLAKVCLGSNSQNCQSEQMKFLTSLKSHMAVNGDQSLNDLLATQKMLDRYGTLLRLCRDVGLPYFSDASSSKQLHQIQLYLVAIKREFETHAPFAKDLIRKGRSGHNIKEGDNFGVSKSRAADILSRGSSSKIMYRDLQQIHAYQKHYEYLVSLKINKLLFELLPPFLKHLKSISADSGKYRQTYRSIYSLVCSNGRTLPALVGNLNDDFFEVNDC